MITSQQNIKSYINVTMGVIKSSVASSLSYYALLFIQYSGFKMLNRPMEEKPHVNAICDNLIYETRLM